jgi:hypothetical protein
LDAQLTIPGKSTRDLCSVKRAGTQQMKNLSNIHKPSFGSNFAEGHELLVEV